jgi:Leucine-rich repeat (LRR) protein
MEESTIDLLNIYPNNITELNISSNDIVGILDLSRFKNLSKLLCFSNSITKIINLPISLTELNCGSNKLKELNELSNEYANLITPFSLKNGTAVRRRNCTYTQA